MNQPQIRAQFNISLDDAGQIAVQGPIENELLFMGIVEMAKKAVIEHNRAAQKLIQELPPGTMLRPGGRT